MRMLSRALGIALECRSLDICVNGMEVGQAATLRLRAAEAGHQPCDFLRHAV